ncbi:MAG: Rpp14/Pop5 family protein [Methanoregula sp.]|jgi:ribonuclease P/MRP protein subunit POP5
MSIRPPTLREKKRYILARLDPAGTAIEARDLYYVMYEAVVSLFGDASAAVIQPSVLAIEKGYVLFRCTRGNERGLALALSTISSCRDCPVALRVMAISGTVESLRERIALFEEKKHGQSDREEPGQAISVPLPAESPVTPGAGDALSPGTDQAGPEGTGSGNTGYRFSGILVEPVVWQGHKVDVIEKGFKNTHRLFLTREDLEIIYATTIPDGL